MSPARLVRPLLLCDALLFVAFGLGYALLPEPLSSWFGSGSAQGLRADFAATAGGLQIGVGAGLFWQACQRGSSGEGLMLAAFATLGIALVRLASLARFEAWNAFNVTLLGIESLGFACNLVLFRLVRNRQE